MAEGIGQLKDVTVIWEGGGCGLTVATDMPGNAMTTRGTATIPFAANRLEQTFPFDNIEGRLIQFTFGTPASAMILMGATYRFRRLGLVIYGQNGEVWTTQPMRFDGIEHPMLFSEIELDCSTTGSMTLQLQTELPGHINAVAASANFNVASRSTINIRLPITCKGALPIINIAGGSECRLYAGRIKGKEMVTGADWNWYSLPIPPTPQEWTEKAIPMRAATFDQTWITLPVDAEE